LSKPGRKPIPFRTELLHSATKVHLGMSARRARGEMLRVVGSGSSLLPSVPNYAQPSRVFNREGTTPIWQDLLRRSAYPLREIEEGSTVAVDSSGFCVTCKAAYCSETHADTPKHEFVKCHAIVGVKSHIVIDARITDEHGGDSPQLIPLLRGALDSGFRPSRVVGDKAYLSRDSCNFADAHGIEPLFPFKSNNTGKSRGSLAFHRMYLLFQLHREEFEERYHARSNVEAVFAAIKSKMGERLFSRNPVARVNELLAKLLNYNISVLIHELYENQIDLTQIGFDAPGWDSSLRGGAQ
jgi:transposase